MAEEIYEDVWKKDPEDGKEYFDDKAHQRNRERFHARCAQSVEQYKAAMEKNDPQTALKSVISK